MRPAFQFRVPASRMTRLAYAAITITAISVVSIFHARPRAWAVNEVPIAFWAWRAQAPEQVDVREAIEKAGARAVFVRAGQIDYQDGKLRRIRPLAGSLPQGIALHLVYNATAVFLQQLDNVDPKAFATVISNAYREDLDRALGDGANVSGLQLDIDFPTRLLGQYQRTLSELRKEIPNGNQLSITGLPTWMESTALDGVLESVDFWVPQFYGGEIPSRSDQLIPISSPESITHFVNKARELNKPFYAGLAAYSVATLYNHYGSLVRLRGDMDPASIAADPNLELIDRRSLSTATTEWRYVFRARADGVLDGLNMRAGDVLVVNVPSSESLRAAARIVRNFAGRQLLGICVFRLPSRTDPATLSIEQVTAALNDRDSSAHIDVRIGRKTNQLFLEFKNTGTASSLIGTLSVDVAVLPGSFEAATLPAGVFVKPMCDAQLPQPCSQRRANLIRFTLQALPPGEAINATLVLNREPPPTMKASITMQTDTGQSYSMQRDITTDTGVNQ